MSVSYLRRLGWRRIRARMTSSTYGIEQTRCVVRALLTADTLTYRNLQRQISLLALVVSVVSCLVTLLSSHYTYHSTCRPILQSILSQKWSTRLNTYLAGTHSELILMTLKLYNGVSAFASGKERKSVLDVFAWETKVSEPAINLFIIRSIHLTENECRHFRSCYSCGGNPRRTM